MKRVIVTVGPSLLHRIRLEEVHRPAYIYRINAAHGSVPSVQATVGEIRTQMPGADILIDLPGNKIRTANLTRPIPLRKNSEFELRAEQTNHPPFAALLKPGDEVWANDSTSRFLVVAASPDRLKFLSQSDGELANNKGLHVRGIHHGLPFLFEKDDQLIELANEMRVAFVGLSFVRTAADVRLVQSRLDPAIRVIAKIETRRAVEQLEPIMELADAILVDRGDLSTEVGLESIPKFQQHIVSMAHTWNCPVYLATQVLKFMEDKPVPTIAEVVDLYNSIRMGIHGVQLSEETAVGKFPKECLEVIDRVAAEWAQERMLEVRRWNAVKQRMESGCEAAAPPERMRAGQGIA